MIGRPLFAEDACRLSRCPRYLGSGHLKLDLTTVVLFALVLLAAACVDAGDDTHPVLSQPSREGYALMAELTRAVESGDEATAARLVVAIGESPGLLLVPDERDPRVDRAVWWVVRGALAKHAGLSEAMESRYGALARLRLNRAMTAGDESGVLGVAEHFPGTTASGEALRWLGDRRMADGRFALASIHHGSAIRWSALSDRAGMDARLRLAGAYLGRDVGEPVSGETRVGERLFSADEFEALLDRLRRRHRGGSGTSEPIGFPPGSYVGRSIGSVETLPVTTPGGFNPDLIWTVREARIEGLGQRLHVSNQASQMLFDPGKDELVWQRRWQTDRRWPLWSRVPMRPLFVGNRIYSRLVTVNGPELLCLDAASGAMVFTASVDKVAISDPFLSVDRLMVVAGRAEGAGRIGVYLTEINPESGTVLERTFLVHFRDSMQGELNFRVLSTEDRILLSGGECLISLDLLGRLHWLRRSVSAPPVEGGLTPRSPGRHRPEHSLPILSHGRVLAAHPGATVLECVELDTGRRLWERPSEGLRRIVDADDDSGLAILEEKDGLTALAMADGTTRWHSPVGLTLQAGFCSQEEGLIWYICQPDQGAPGSAPGFNLGWVDLKTGHSKQAMRAALPAVVSPAIGPLVPSGDGAYLLLGARALPLRREIHRLEKDKRG